MHPIKEQLVQKLQAQLQQSIATAKNAIAAAQESKLSETKSSAGDKFETGRAMMQMEQEKNEMQLSKAFLLEAQLENLSLKDPTQLVSMGSLVKTTAGYFFLSIGLGKIIIDEQLYFCISRDAPISKSLLGAQLNTELFFNGSLITILEIT